MLTARDINRNGWFHGPNNTHCLLGWCRTVFQLDETYDAAEDAICQFLPRGMTAIDFNDNSKPSESAAIWNRAMARLGYVVGNPEAKNVERKRK